jgi:hypothetical protein
MSSKNNASWFSGFKTSRRQRQSRRARSSSTRRLGFEVMEFRRMLSASPAHSDCVACCAPLANYGVGSLPIGIATGGFNSDSFPDLAVGNAGSDDVSILIANGDGTFQPAVHYAAGDNVHYITAGNFDANGMLDLAVANYDSGDVSILLGNGNGTFQTAVNYDVGFGAQFPVAGDFNMDGWTDLAVSSFANDNVSILLNNHDGTFQAAVPYAVASAPVGVTVGNFNGDGKPDLAVANYHRQTDGSISILLGNGDGTFQPAVDYAVGGDISAIFVEEDDFNRDGRTDLVSTNWISGTVSILLGNGDGTFQPAVNYAVCENPSYLVRTDFNADRNTDLAVTNFGSDTVSILLGNGDGTFQGAVNYKVGDAPFSLALGYFDSDSFLDLATANFNGNDVSVLLNIPELLRQGGCVFVDTTPPETTIESVMDGYGDALVDGESTLSNSNTVVFSSNEAGSSFEYNLDGAGFVAGSSSLTLSSLADGPHTLEIRAIDSAGNIDPSPALINWIILTPSQAIKKLHDDVMELAAKQAKQDAKPLEAAATKLEAAAKKAEDGTRTNDVAAIGQLEAFINQLLGMQKKKDGSDKHSEILIFAALKIQNAIYLFEDGAER